MGDAYYAIVLRCRGWLISFERNRKRYRLIDLVRDANKVLNQPPIDRNPKFLGLTSRSPQKPTLKWPINTNDLLKVFDKRKGRKRIKITILERKSQSLIDKLAL